MSEFIIVYVTVSSKGEAEKIANALLADHLIACVNIIGPVFSRFHWAGEIDSSEEYMMVMKTSLGLFSALEKRIKGLHSYEVPEIIAVPIVKGSTSYLNWMSISLKY
ncbi:MAG: divalent-cation tolerance protein CutA [Nitrososphaerota archaeon]|nr:divalent-cation tolerance protein CutA [Nitrososphaerota archaeon]